MARAVLLLLAALLCSAAATLDAEEKQKEEEAPDSAREFTKENLVERAPGTPQNLDVSPQTSTVVSVTWDEPSSGSAVYYYYVYVVDITKEDNTTGTSYRWTGLEACTDYEFGVRAVSAEGEMSNPAQDHGTTLVGVPPQPQDLRVDDYTRTTVTLAWVKPDTQCDIVNYRVTYRGGGSDSQEINVIETTVVVEELLSDTTYTFSVYAATSEGESRFPATIQQTTAPDHGPPEDLVAQGISSSAINISWSAPFMEPTNYLVSSPLCMDTEETVNGLTYLITDLDPCQSCSITVSSFYDSEGIELSETTTAESQEGAPPAPEPCTAKVDKDAINVYWKQPTTACVLGPYYVTWTWQKLWGDGKEESNSTDTTGESYTVYSPLPYHNYTFEITASVDGLFGSPTFCSGTSLEAPAGPPVLLSVVSEEEGVAQVTWESPAEENGEIFQYGIFINDESSPNTTVDAKVHSTTVSLQKCVSVNISVEACNHAGWGERSEVKELIVANDVLPKELSCPEPNPEVQVCWEPATSCPVSYYNLKWDGDVLWSENADSSSTTLEWSENEICYNIPSTPYTRYTVELSVGTKTNETIKCSVTTPMAASSPPTDVHQTVNSPNSVTIEWFLPKFIRGKLLGWHLNWTTLTNEYIDEHHINDPESMTFQINELSPSETYIVYIMAVNGVGKGEAEEQKVNTASNPSTDLGIILGVSIGGGVILILLIATGITVYNMKNKKKTLKPPIMPDAIDSGNDGISTNPRLSIAASQQFPRESIAIDPNNDKVPSSPTTIAEFNRSEDVNKRMENFEEYSKDSSHDHEGKPNVREYRRRPSQPNNKKFVRRSSQQIDLDKPNLKKIGRRPSQQTNLGRPNLKEFGRRPSQQIDLGRSNLKEFGRRPSQQIEQARPSLADFGRRPSQQIGVGRPNLREYGRRPSQQIDIGRPRSGEYARRSSQEVNIDARVFSSPSSKQPIPTYDHYMRRPSQQADIGMVGNRGFMRRPSQQIITTFDGIQE